MQTAVTTLGIRILWRESVWTFFRRCTDQAVRHSGNCQCSCVKDLRWTCWVCFHDLSEASVGAKDCLSSWKAWDAWEWNTKKRGKGRGGGTSEWVKESQLWEAVSLPLEYESVKTELVLTSPRISPEHAWAGRADTHAETVFTSRGWDTEVWENSSHPVDITLSVYRQVTRSKTKEKNH